MDVRKLIGADSALPLGAMQEAITENLLLGFSRTMQHACADAALVDLANDDTLTGAELYRALEFWRAYRTLIDVTYASTN